MLSEWKILNKIKDYKNPYKDPSLGINMEGLLSKLVSLIGVSPEEEKMRGVEKKIMIRKFIEDITPYKPLKLDEDTQTHAVTLCLNRALYEENKDNHSEEKEVNLYT